jgi:hypothetical protein
MTPDEAGAAYRDSILRLVLGQPTALVLRQPTAGEGWLLPGPTLERSDGRSSARVAPVVTSSASTRAGRRENSQFVGPAPGRALRSIMGRLSGAPVVGQGSGRCEGNGPGPLAHMSRDLDLMLCGGSAHWCPSPAIERLAQALMPIGPTAPAPSRSGARTCRGTGSATRSRADCSAWPWTTGSQRPWCRKTSSSRSPR